MQPENYGAGQSLVDQNWSGVGCAPYLMNFPIVDLAGDADISNKLLASVPVGYTLSVLGAGIVMDATYQGTGVAQVETASVVCSGAVQVETATVAGTIGAAGAGNATVIVTAAGMVGSPKTYSVAVANNDTAAIVAGKIFAAFNADAALKAIWTPSNPASGPTIVLTRVAAAANDATLNISIDNGTCTGLTTAATSANTTAGKSQAVQTSGNLSVVVTSAQVTGSPVTVLVPVTAGDDAAAVATKIRAGLNANSAVGSKFVASGETNAVIMTSKLKLANDSSLNVAIADGTCAGVDTAASSANTTAGVVQTATAVSVKNGSNVISTRTFTDETYPAANVYADLGTVSLAYKSIASSGSMMLDVTNTGGANIPTFSVQLLVCLDQAF